MSTITVPRLPSRSGFSLPNMVVSGAVGIVITLALFWTMQHLIVTAELELSESVPRTRLDFVRVKRDETIRKDKPIIDKPPPPLTPPDRPAQPDFEDPDVSVDFRDWGSRQVPVERAPGPDSAFGIAAEGDYLPIVKVAPIYPQRALSRGIEGHCDVEYTVTRQGTTQNPRVVESACTSTLFHQASVQAALKFKYKPRIIDGVPVEVTGVRNRFTYRISG